MMQNIGWYYDPSYSVQVEVSDRDIQGKTALHWAAECPQVRMHRHVTLLHMLLTQLST